ncbi:MAG: methylamine utilization protein [Gammaproteobacteria bacterium]|nr:methylamine utilization protein [Gammaproteobacteria bacterium]
MKMRLIPLLVLAWSATCTGADLRVQVTDGEGKPLADAVATLESPGDPVAETDPARGRAVLAQRGHRFVPFVLPIRRGTVVEFPNHDDTRHHVYSFSPARTFEIELYRGDPEKTITFDTSGVVAVGCNIHDYMQAFIFVTDASRFGRSGDDGLVVFEDVGSGERVVKVWHPWQQAETQPRTLAAETTELTLVVDLDLPPPRRPEENALKQWVQEE